MKDYAEYIEVYGRTIIMWKDNNTKRMAVSGKTAEDEVSADFVVFGVSELCGGLDRTLQTG